MHANTSTLTRELENVLDAKRLDRATFQWGTHTLQRAQYQEFVAAAREVDVTGTDRERQAQIEALTEIKAGRTQALAAPVPAAPSGTTVDKLLNVEGQQNPPDGMYKLGNVRVPVAEFDQFAKAQRALCEKNPEALATLHLMETRPDAKPLTMRLNTDGAAGAKFEAESNTIRWSPVIAARDAATHHIVPPVTGLLHEETHWAGGRLHDVLVKIPDPEFDNHEERRVITGAESRDLALRGLPPRTSHKGSSIPVLGQESVVPGILVIQDGKVVPKGVGFQTSGHIVAMNANSVTLQTLENSPESKMILRKSDMQLAMGVNAENMDTLVRDAAHHGDKLAIHVTHDGISYDNRVQFDRLRDSPVQANNEVGARMQQRAAESHGRYAAHAANQGLAL